MSDATSNDDLAGREIRSSRLISAPRELVFRAFAEPEHLKQWWGPKGFTNTFHEFDFRVGGMWRFIMHGPGGHDFENESVFVEIVEPEKIVFDHLRTMHVFRMAMTFEAQGEKGEKTLVSWRMTFESAEECMRVRKFAAPANEENFDKLTAELATMRP